MSHIYNADQQLPAVQLAWYDGNGALIDLSTFSAAKVIVTDKKLSAPGVAVLLTKTASLTLAATSPNYIIQMTAADMLTIAPATGEAKRYLNVYAKRTADSLWDCFRPGDPVAITVVAVPA